MSFQAFPRLVRERDQLSEELQRLREEVAQARELSHRAREERDEAKDQRDRMREERDKAREENRAAREDREQLERKVVLLQERCDRLTCRVRYGTDQGVKPISISGHMKMMNVLKEPFMVECIDTHVFTSTLFDTIQIKTDLI